MSTPQELSREEQQDLITALTVAFSPAAPVNTRDLFAGRLNELARILSTVNSRGEHAIVFGERGVGKTSIANVARILMQSDSNVYMTNCHEGDNFEAVWRRLFAQVSVVNTYTPAGFTGTPETTRSAMSLLDQQVDPGAVQELLFRLSDDKQIVIIIDEFDRIGNNAQNNLFADTIKWLSDTSCNTTIVLVGVASSVETLILNHASIERALVQIKMPRMADDELRQIIDTALALPIIQMNIQNDAKDLIIYLSQGLPYYTHLISRDSAVAAVKLKSRTIADTHVVNGIKSALRDKHESLGRAYQNAIQSQRKDALFKQVLLACALAPVDELGYFSTTDIRGPLSKIIGRPYSIQNYQGHLVKFHTEHTRGPVLERKGERRQYRYRFINPLLQPYIIMKGIDEDLIDKNLRDNLMGIQPVSSRTGLLC